MKVNMEYRLTCARVVVVYNSEPVVRNTLNPCNLHCSAIDCAKHCIVLGQQIKGIDDMFSGDYQQMHRSNRCNILNHHDLIVLVYESSGNHAVNDLAEK